MREAVTICPAPCKLTFDLLTLKVVYESCVTCATSVPILVFLGLSVLDLGPMYATNRQTSDRQTSDAHHRLTPPYPRGAGIMMNHRPRKIGRAHSCGGWSVIRVHSISVSRIRNAILVRIAVNVNIFRVT